MLLKCIERRLPLGNSRINQADPTSSTLRVRLLLLRGHLLTRLDASPPSLVDLDEGGVPEKEAAFLSQLALPHPWFPFVARFMDTGIAVGALEEGGFNTLRLVDRDSRLSQTRVWIGLYDNLACAQLNPFRPNVSSIRSDQ
jgi:hypothetical protein